MFSHEQPASYFNLNLDAVLSLTIGVPSSLNTAAAVGRAVACRTWSAVSGNKMEVIYGCGESGLHSITLNKVSHGLNSMQPVGLMLCFKHIPTFREHGNMLKWAVQTLLALPKSQMIHGKKHHLKMVRTAGRKEVKRKVYYMFSR